MFIIKGLNQFFVFFVVILLSNFCFAQSSEIKAWSSVEYGFDINEVLKINLSQHFRLKEDLNVIDTYITESDISFEPIKKLKLLGQLRYYSRNDNFGGIQGFENMMRYRFGIEKKLNSNKLNFELRFAYQNRFSLDRENRFKKRIDPRKYNGAVLLGLNGIVVKSHGGTDAFGFCNAISVAVSLIENSYISEIEKKIKI